MKRAMSIALMIVFSLAMVAVVSSIALDIGRTENLKPVLSSSGEMQVAAEPPDSPESLNQGTVYYIRTDGGTANQCTGVVDAAYSGSGSNQPCAWSHPFIALPPGGTPRIVGGDTLIIASGEYRMGYNAPDPENYCDADGGYVCHMPPIPSGPDAAHPTRILGAGWDSGCANPPELWGTERVYMLLNLTDTSNLQVACLELTDHSNCADDHGLALGGTPLTCERENHPFGDWAEYGIYAEDSSNVHLKDLNIHGFGIGGIWAGRLTDWTVEDVRIAGNGMVGWEGDVGEDSSNQGTLTFRRLTVEWNGCAETYPGGEPTGCWSQTAGGYGDGIGTGATGGDWIFEDSQILHNTSDGIDLLYHSLGGSITLERVRAEGNAGQQVKVTGQTSISNSVLVGNCAFFDGQSFTYNVDACRANGDTFVAAYTGGEAVSIVNTTIYGQGDCLLGAGPREGYQCDGTETFTGRNNILQGDVDYGDPGDLTCLYYQEGCGSLPFGSDYSIVYTVKDSMYVPGPHDMRADPQLSGPLSGNEYGMDPTSGSPAIDSGDNTVCPASDYRGISRPIDGDDDGVAICDMGAYEYGDAPPVLPTPTQPTPAPMTFIPQVYNGTGGETELQPMNLDDVQYWAYQIQEISEPGRVDALEASHYDMLVLEPTRTDWSSVDRLFDTKAMVTRLKNSTASDGVHRKLVIAYIDIGEAEDWRWYWTWSTDWDCVPPIPEDWPDYIISCDPDGWSGNYPLAYWDARWKDIIIYGQNQDSTPYGDYNSVIDEVIKSGFDGIYLDWVEAFEDASVIAAAQQAGVDPAEEMIDFIQEMRDYATFRNPNFIIIQQNAASLIDGHPELTNVIDAIAQEAIWYDGDADVDWDDSKGYDYANGQDLVDYYIDYLWEYQVAGLPVFDCEYALEHAADAYTKSYDEDFVPYATRRSLSHLTTTPPPGY